IAEARRALELEPDSADIRDTLGAALARKGELDAALEVLNSALRMDPNLPRLHYNLGSVLLEKGEVSEAISHFQAELRIKPNFPEGQNKLSSSRSVEIRGFGVWLRRPTPKPVGLTTQLKLLKTASH